jgi:hypothetical protein
LAFLKFRNLPNWPSAVVCGSKASILKIHLGVEAEFRPACKAHPALLVEDLRSLVALLLERGIPVVNDNALEGFFRVYVSDPFGNRIELMEPLK